MAFKNAVERVESWTKNAKIGDSVEAYYVKKELSTSSKFGENMKYILRLDDGKLIALYGSTSITPQMENVPLGARVKITYIEDIATGKGSPFKSYEILFDEDNITSDLL